MKTIDIVDSSAAAFIYTFTKPINVQKYLAYMKLNHIWLQKFKQLIISSNGNLELAQHFVDECKNQYLGQHTNIVLLHNEINMGHTFGILDSDGRIFDYAINHPNIEYIWKFSGDVLANETIFDINIDEQYDFFYINNVGFPSLKNTTIEKLADDIMNQKYFCPQTNYYIVKNKIKEWYPNHELLLNLKQKYDSYLNNKDNERLPPWEVIRGSVAGLPDGQGLSCELYLAQTVIKNNMTKQNLVSLEDTKKILSLMAEFQNNDGSHKNIIYTNIGGLCHYHFMNGMVTEI